MNRVPHMYEAKHQPVLPTRSFYRRFSLHLLAACGFFALYAGLLFIVCAALVLTPVLHRVLHRFHFEQRA